MLIGISLQSYGSVCITSWMQGIFSAFTFHFDCMGMPSLLGFLIRAGMACTIVFLIRCWIPDCHCLIQRSIVLTLLLTLHIFHAVLPWCSPLHTVISWLLSHFSIAKLRQADYRKYRWHYLRHKKFGNLPHFSFLRLHFSPFRFPFHVKWVFHPFSLKLFACALSLLTFR